MNMWKLLACTLVAGLLTAKPVWSDDMMSGGQPSMGARVLSDLHQDNQNEIEMGRMAKKKGSSEQVRSYGDQVLKDHQDAD